MRPRDYLVLAETLAQSAKEQPEGLAFAAMCRSAISRAYYSVFLTLRELVDSWGIETRRIPSPHATIEHALRNSGNFSLQKIANGLRSLCTDRTDADYDLHNTDVETISKVDSVVAFAASLLSQVEIIVAGKITPAIDTSAVVEAILKWVRDNSKALWRKSEV